jgi:hypothetical protein
MRPSPGRLTGREFVEVSVNAVSYGLSSAMDKGHPRQPRRVSAGCMLSAPVAGNG